LIDVVGNSLGRIKKGGKTTDVFGKAMRLRKRDSDGDGARPSLVDWNKIRGSLKFL